ncbi:helix-turn-helix domain-containing protein [Celeribacter baekdonensis]|uniref:winged helix-turn-helix transcriptional regulator n=1 Tax=Celeribacter baekdonensis TaxID=875171 RepID=UPI0030DB22DB|tara:strand:+ start:1997 stop:2437 length:441 start_codon:yes stop_codon:yes gene_type:complete
MKWNELHSDACPVARGLSVIGDRWTMMIVRECFLGVRRFDEMQARLGITRHVLADRLRKLEADGVLHREAYQDRPLRYEYRLTAKGKALHPVLVTLIDWANVHVPGDQESSITLLNRRTQTPLTPVLIDVETGDEITHLSVTPLGS